MRDISEAQVRRRARARHLAAVWDGSGFRRLFAVRLLGQFGDGVFQASLAGAVLFDPQRQSSPADIAAGFAVVLVPYSLLGPFAGVLLDRWSRQRVLTLANVARLGAVLVVAAELAAAVSGPVFYGSALVVVSLSRLVLSALSASLPHVVVAGDRVTANALSATAGTIATAAGGGVAVTARSALDDHGVSYATVAVGAGICYLLGAWAAAGFARHRLGPTDDQHDARETVAQIGRGLLAGARHVASRPPVRAALAVIGAHRLGFGLWTVCTVLLYRNHFAPDGVLRTGLAGLSQVVFAVAVGGAVAALIAPVAFRRLGPVRSPAAALVLAATTQVTLVLPCRLELQLPAAALLAFAAQTVKINVDTVLQNEVTDEFRGRVFALYDMVFNIALVVAALATALLLPADGRSTAAVLAAAGLFAVAACGYLTTARRATT